MRRIAALLAGAIPLTVLALASPASAKVENVEFTTPFGSVRIAEVTGPAKGRCVDIPVAIDVENSRRAAAALPLRVSITDESDRPVAVAVWNPTRQPIAGRTYDLTMKACGKPHRYAVPSLGRGYNVVTWDPRGEFQSGGTIDLDDVNFSDFDIYSFVKDYDFHR